MTIEELNQKCTAMHVDKLEIDYISRKVCLHAQGEYGYKEELREKSFCVEFEDCIWMESVRLNGFKGEETWTEFISWGIEKDIEKFVERMRSFMSQTINGGFVDWANRYRYNFDEMEKNLRGFYFENALGDAIWLVCKEVRVSVS